MNLMALIPKPSGAGLRTVAKAPMLYRCWGAVRRPIVEGWEVERAAPWDRARPGSGALDAAMDRAVVAEAAVLNGQHVGSVFWDFIIFRSR